MDEGTRLLQMGKYLDMSGFDAHLPGGFAYPEVRLPIPAIAEALLPMILKPDELPPMGSCLFSECVARYEGLDPDVPSRRAWAISFYGPMELLVITRLVRWRLLTYEYGGETIFDRAPELWTGQLLKPMFYPCLNVLDTPRRTLRKWYASEYDVLMDGLETSVR